MKIVSAKFVFEDGTEYTPDVPEYTFSSGRQGNFARVSLVLKDGTKLGGQIQIWKATKQ